MKTQRKALQIALLTCLLPRRIRVSLLHLITGLSNPSGTVVNTEIVCLLGKDTPIVFSHRESNKSCDF